MSLDAAAAAVPPLVISDLVVAYGARRVIDGVNLEIGDGELVALIGPNGAGKSTMIDVVAGISTCASGRIELNGRDVTSASTMRRHSMGLARTHQTPALIGPTPRLEVAIASCRGRGVLRGAFSRPSRTDLRKAGALLEEVGLPSRLHDVATATLGLSEQRLLELSRATASQPEVLLLDEPASGLSTTERHQFAALLRRLAGRLRGVLLVEHDMSLVEAVADRVVALDRGIVIADGSFADVLGDPRVRTAYLGFPEDEGVA